MTYADTANMIQDPTNRTTASFRSTWSDKLKEYHRSGVTCSASWYGGANDATNDNETTITEIVRHVTFAVRRYFKDTICNNRIG